MTPAEIENVYRAADSHPGGLVAVFKAGQAWALLAFAQERQQLQDLLAQAQTRADTAEAVASPSALQNIKTLVFGAKKAPS
jgi:hypothetical protein